LYYGLESPSLRQIDRRAAFAERSPVPQSIAVSTRGTVNLPLSAAVSQTLFVRKLKSSGNSCPAFGKRKNAKTTVCEVSSMSISDNITPLAIKARLHNNQKIE
jgi:hypothetical protein